MIGFLYYSVPEMADFLPNVLVTLFRKLHIFAGCEVTSGSRRTCTDLHDSMDALLPAAQQEGFSKGEESLRGRGLLTSCDVHN